MAESSSQDQTCAAGRAMIYPPWCKYVEPKLQQQHEHEHEHVYEHEHISCTTDHVCTQASISPRKTTPLKKPEARIQIPDSMNATPALHTPCTVYRVLYRVSCTHARLRGIYPVQSSPAHLHRTAPLQALTRLPSWANTQTKPSFARRNLTSPRACLPFAVPLLYVPCPPCAVPLPSALCRAGSAKPG